MSYFSIGEQIVDRLRQEVPELLAVYTPAEIGDAEEGSQIAPCVHVVYNGDRLKDTGGRGAVSLVVQQWVLVLAVQNSAAQLDNSALMADAGILIPKILAAVQGWQPAASSRPLVRVDAPAPQYRPAFAYYPIALEGVFSI